SPPDHPNDKSRLDASAKLTRDKLNKRSGDANLSKDKSGPESPPEFQRSWCVKGHVRSGVISLVLAQWYLRTIRQSTSDTRRQTRSTMKSQKTPSKNKEPTHLRRSRRLEDRSTTREKARRERPKPTPFIQRITHFKYHKRVKLPRNIRVYEGNKDPEDHSGGVARNWFDDLDPKSVDSFEELSQKFLEEFSQQKRYAKDPTEIHGIKRWQNKGLQAFMDRFKSESSHIKGIPSVLRISTFMQGSKPSLGEKLPLDQQKLFVLIKETKDTFGWHGLEDLKEPETGAAQGKHEGIWGCTLLIPEKILSPRLPRL
nr:reverse transcriptase domain-containing protein [Tanacetum cinerariifolium]